MPRCYTLTARVEVPIDKVAAVAAVLTALREELAALDQVTRMAVDEATSAESKAENKWDTRGLESSYLAAGQGERMVALRRLVGFFEAEPAVRLVGVENDAPETAWFLLAPEGGGRRVVVDGVPLVVVTPGSPAGAALVGVSVGDDVRLAGGEATVVALS